MKSIWFIGHQWKESFRSNFWQKSLALNILIGIMLVMLLGNLLALGWLLDKLLLEAFPDDDPVAILNSGMIYFFLFGLLARYLMQPLPTLNVEAYLHLPIRRNTLVNFVIFKSVVSIFNIIPLLFLIPVTFRLIAPWHSMTDALLWMAMIILMVVANNFLGTYIKRQLSFKPWIALLVTGIIGGAILLDYFGAWSLRTFSQELFGLVIRNGGYLVVFLAWMLLTYLLNFRFLKARLYPEEINNRKRVRVDRLTGVRYFESLGLTGEIITLEIKLWLRHKRTKTMLYMLPIFLLYGLFFYPTPTYKNMYGMFIFVGVFMSGGLMMNYLNYAFGYESGYFDAILTKEIDLRKYIKAKLIIGWLICSVCYVLTIPYVFFGFDILLANTVTFLFNLGLTSHMLLYMATFNKKAMDMQKGAAFNYQGIGATNWLSIIPAMVVPPLIYLPFGTFIGKYAGFAVIGLLGITGLVMGRYIMTTIYDHFKQRKYIMAEGFRQ